MKELLNRDTQAITQFFDGRHCGAVIPATNDVVYSGLGYTTEGT